MTSFIRKNISNNISSCTQCIYWDNGDQSVGIQNGCTHPILIGDNDEPIDENVSAIEEAIDYPNHCVLCVKKECIWEQED